MDQELTDIINNNPELQKLNDKEWRMNHLYRIIDKNGNSIKFKLNPVLSPHNSEQLPLNPRS